MNTGTYFLIIFALIPESLSKLATTLNSSSSSDTLPHLSLTFSRSDSRDFSIWFSLSMLGVSCANLSNSFSIVSTSFSKRIRSLSWDDIWLRSWYTSSDTVSSSSIVSKRVAICFLNSFVFFVRDTPSFVRISISICFFC